MPSRSQRILLRRILLIAELAISFLLALAQCTGLFFVLHKYLQDIPTVFITFPIVFLFFCHCSLYFNLICLSFSANVSFLEMAYLSTNPRKTGRYWSKTDSASKIIGTVFASVPHIASNVIRNALWINVTAISTYSSVLPMSVRTRASTILNAINVRSKLEKELDKPKGSVKINIAEKHRMVEENRESNLSIPYRKTTEKYWRYWNDLAYEPRHFVEKDGSRITVGRVRTSIPGEYPNSLGENKGFHIDTGDHVEIVEVPGMHSSISFRASNGANVSIPLTCEQANNLVHWVWQHSTDTVYGALEGRDASVVNRNTWELDIFLCIFGIMLRLYFFWYFQIIDDRSNPKASPSVSLALLHLSIVAVVYTIRQSYLKDWVKYRGKKVSSELCYVTLPDRGKDRLAKIMRTIIATEADEKDRSWMRPVFIADSNEDLLIDETWGIDCSNTKHWLSEEESNLAKFGALAGDDAV